MTASVALVIPLIQPLLDLPEEGSIDAAVADLVAASPLSSHDPALVGAHYTITQIDNPSSYPGVGTLWSPPEDQRLHSTLVIEVQDPDFINRFSEAFTASNPGMTEATLHEVMPGYAIQNVEAEVNAALLLANVLRPGSLSTYKGYGLFQGKSTTSTTPFYAEEWYRAVAASDKYKWPTFQRLTIAAAWSWLGTVGCFVDGIALGKTGRALAALSYVAPPEPEAGSLNLAWIMLGLEALYAVGNMGLKEQLVEKTELVLGARSENKKAFGHLYDFRSRLLHGDVDLPLRFSTFDAVPYFEQHLEELGDYEGLGLAALCATIQTMIAHDWRELRFRRALDPVATRPGAGAA